MSRSQTYKIHDIELDGFGTTHTEDMDFSSYVDDTNEYILQKVPKGGITIPDSFPERPDIDLPYPLQSLESALEALLDLYPWAGEEWFSPRDILRDILKEPGKDVPRLRVRYRAEGNCDNVSRIRFHHQSLLGGGGRSYGGSASIGGTVSIEFEFVATVWPMSTRVESCTCPNGRTGARRSQDFEIDWDLKVTVTPGPKLQYDLAEISQTVHSPCCCDAADEANTDRLVDIQGDSEVARELDLHQEEIQELKQRLNRLQSRIRELW